jgi:multicomponent Na+:H+ antiporter subunit G
MTASATVVQVWVGGGLLGLAVLAALIAALGLLRFPDVYTRLHAAAIARGAVVWLALLGFAVLAWDIGVSVRLFLLGALIWAVGPAVAALTGHAAHAGGIAPLAGQFRSPRPGQDQSRGPGDTP